MISSIKKREERKQLAVEMDFRTRSNETSWK
jgi:hypothetical protein